MSLDFYALVSRVLMFSALIPSSHTICTAFASLQKHTSSVNLPSSPRDFTILVQCFPSINTKHRKSHVDVLLERRNSQRPNHYFSIQELEGIHLCREGVDGMRLLR